MPSSPAACSAGFQIAARNHDRGICPSVDSTRGQILWSVRHVAALLEYREIGHHSRRVRHRGAQLAHMVPAFHWLRFVKGPPGSRQHPSGSRHTAWYTASYTKATVWRGPPSCLRFPGAFRLPSFASWPSCPATDIRIPRGPPTSGRSPPPDRDGVSMFRTGEIRPGPGAPYTPGPWCSHGRRGNSGHHCRLPAAGPVLRCRIPSPEFWVTKLTGVHLIRPSRSFPCL